MEKAQECANIGNIMRNLLELDLKPRDIVTRTSFENAIRYIIATGAFTNAVLHLIAIAHSYDVKLNIDDFQKFSDETPLLADFKPSGKYVMADLQKFGGTPAVIKFLLCDGILNGSPVTVMGKSLKDTYADLPGLPANQPIVHPVSSPIKPNGHLHILTGSLAPEGAAKVYNDEESFITAL